MKSFFKIRNTTRLFVLVVVIAVACCTTLTAQKVEIFEGYDGFPWGTTLEEIQQKRPGAYVHSKLLYNALVLQFNEDAAGIRRLYLFSTDEKKLIRAVTVYPTDIKNNLLSLLRDTYGESDSRTYENYDYVWDLSDTFMITFTVYTSTVYTSIEVEYINPKAWAEFQERRKENIKL